MKMRSISVEFQKELKTGSLSKLLKYVLKDDTLCLELRGDFINIYSVMKYLTDCYSLIL